MEMTERCPVLGRTQPSLCPSSAPHLPQDKHKPPARELLFLHRLGRAGRGERWTGTGGFTRPSTARVVLPRAGRADRASSGESPTGPHTFHCQPAPTHEISPCTALLDCFDVYFYFYEIKGNFHLGQHGL